MGVGEELLVIAQVELLVDTVVEQQQGQYHILLMVGLLLLEVMGVQQGALLQEEGGIVVQGTEHPQGLGHMELVLLVELVNPASPCMPNGQHRHQPMPQGDQEELATLSHHQQEVELLRSNLGVEI